MSTHLCTCARVGGGQRQVHCFTGDICAADFLILSMKINASFDSEFERFQCEYVACHCVQILTLETQKRGIWNTLDSQGKLPISPQLFGMNIYYIQRNGRNLC